MIQNQFTYSDIDLLSKCRYFSGENNFQNISVQFFQKNLAINNMKVMVIHNDEQLNVFKFPYCGLYIIIPTIL